MNEKEIMEIIGKGECQTIEFKKSTTDITKDVYESICAFSNRDGGHVFLGVKDNGEILGIEPNSIKKIKKDFVTAINNANKMYPPLFLAPVEYEIQERIILHIFVPVGTQVSRCSGRIYDRNNESDIDITDNEELVLHLPINYTFFACRNCLLLRCFRSPMPPHRLPQTPCIRQSRTSQKVYVIGKWNTSV